MQSISAPGLVARQSDQLFDYNDILATYRQIRRSTNMPVMLLRQVVRYQRAHWSRNRASLVNVVWSSASGQYWIFILHPWLIIQRVRKLSSSAAPRGMRPSQTSIANLSIKALSRRIWVLWAEVRPDKQEVPPSICVVAEISKFRRSR